MRPSSPSGGALQALEAEAQLRDPPVRGNPFPPVGRPYDQHGQLWNGYPLSRPRGVPIARSDKLPYARPFPPVGRRSGLSFGPLRIGCPFPPVGRRSGFHLCLHPFPLAQPPVSMPFAGGGFPPQTVSRGPAFSAFSDRRNLFRVRFWGVAPHCGDSLPMGRPLAAQGQVDRRIKPSPDDRGPLAARGRGAPECGGPGSQKERS